MFGRRNPVRRVDVGALAAALAGGARVVDVREPAEYASGHVPGAVNVPLGQVAGRAAELAPADGPVYVVCQSGVRSMQGARRLLAAGLDAVSVDGGTAGWIAAGRPVVRGHGVR